MAELHSAGWKRGVVAAPHALAAEAGRAILAEGGNAIEAMIAMAATIAAVYPHMNHIGGDGFWLVREPNGRVRAIMAPGPAGSKATRELYRATRRDPAARAARRAHRAGRGRRLDAGARCGEGERRQAAARHAARCGDQACARRLCGDAQPGGALGGEACRAEGRAGLRRRVPAGRQAARRRATGSSRLRSRRRSIIWRNAGLDDFYRGDVGREIAADLERIGSPVTRDDLARYRATVAEPLSVKLNAGTVFNTPPPTQGLASLLILALYERLRVTEAESFEFAHGLVECTKRAFRVRDRYVTDPAQLPHPPARYFEPKFLDIEVEKIDRRKAAQVAGAAGRGRHDLDGRGGRERLGGVLHPVAVLGVRLGLRAAGDRRADAEPRRELLARSEGGEPAAAGPAAVPHAQSGARRARRRPRHGLRHHGRRRPAADPGDAVRAPRAVSPAARQGARCAALAARPHLGLGRTPICGWNRASTAT